MKRRELLLGAAAALVTPAPVAEREITQTVIGVQYETRVVFYGLYIEDAAEARAFEKFYSPIREGA